MRRENDKDEWLDKAFQLAFFLHGKREMAKRIAVNAMNKLETASNAQFKRFYYTPVGRAEHSRPTRSRVSLNDLQLLQRLVFVESESFEREEESDKKISEKNLLKFFIKHLIRISLKRNSFYVTLAVSRILHNYGTADAMELYNLVVQDPERVHDDYYYRSRKAVLMKELKQRFGNLLETVRINRGEERFQSRTADEDLCRTARESLKFFTPWNSLCALPEKFDPFDDVIKPFYFDKDDPDAEHCIEINRIHAAIHPNCFDRLTEALHLPAPKEKMEIPKFMINTDQIEFDDHNRSDPPHLEADELQKIKDILTAQAESRRAMAAGFLRVVVDGAERARINLEETGAVTFDMDAEAELIEVRMVEKENEIVLATHLLSFDELECGNRIQSVVLEGGQKVSFNLAPAKDKFGEITGLTCGIEYAETTWQKRFGLVLRRKKFVVVKNINYPNRILQPVLTFSLIVLALTLGWLAFRNFSAPHEERVNAPILPDQKSEVNISESLPKKEENENFANDATPKNLKKPDQLLAGQTERPVMAEKKKSQSENKPQILQQRKATLGVPPKELRAITPPRSRQEEIDADGILRLPIRENNQSLSNERIGTSRNAGNRFSSNNRGKPLNEIKQIYIEITGDQILGAQIGDQISAELGKSGRFFIVGDKEQADAALKIYVRHESDVDAPEEKMVTAIVRLVNAGGFVVYPNRKGISGWKYVGAIAKLPARMASDLAKAK